MDVQEQIKALKDEAVALRAAGVRASSRRRTSRIGFRMICPARSGANVMTLVREGHVYVCV